MHEKRYRNYFLFRKTAITLKKSYVKNFHLCSSLMICSSQVVYSPPQLRNSCSTNSCFRASSEVWCFCTAHSVDFSHISVCESFCIDRKWIPTSETRSGEQFKASCPHSCHQLHLQCQHILTYTEWLVEFCEFDFRNTAIAWKNFSDFSEHQCARCAQRGGKHAL